MSVLSLFPIHNSVEEGFELAGYDIAVNCNNAIGIIGTINRKLTNAVKSLRPLFFVGVSDRNKKVDIEGYIISTHFSTPEEYQCSRNITWIVGIMDNTVHNKFLAFPASTNNTFDDIHPDTAITLAIACNINDTINSNAVMSDYDKYYGFSPFNEQIR